MTRNPEVPAQSACRDCKRCTNSDFADMSRSIGPGTAALGASGPCELCGHQMSLHGETANRPLADYLEQVSDVFTPDPPLSDYLRARQPLPQDPQQQAPATERREILERLTRLRDSGALTDEEYEDSKAQIKAWPEGDAEDPRT